MPKHAHTLDNLLLLLEKKSSQLRAYLPIDWRFAPRRLRNPLAARPKPDWPKAGAVPDTEPGPWWFLADFSFPDRMENLPLAGSEGLFFLSGLLPFTLWINGEEIFREEHAWMATGPIAEPLSLPIEPGRILRLAMRVEPIHFGPGAGLMGGMSALPAVDLATDLAAASAQLRYARSLASTPALQRLVESAAARIRPGDLQANRWDRVRSAIDRMEEDLRPFSDAARDTTLHLVGHSHIDMDWQWTWNDTVHCIRRDMKSAVDLMDDYPDLTYSCPQVPIYDVVRKMDPAIFRRIRERLEEGRWENLASTHVEGDLFMADGESVVRQLAYAAAYSREHLGRPAQCLWEPDTFGHPGNMPQLARLAGMESYFHLRCNPGGDEDAGMWPMRLWKGIDGTEIPTFSTYYSSQPTPLTVVRRAMTCREAGLRNALQTWGIGDHGGGMSRHLLRQLARFRDKPVMPRIRFSTMQALTRAVNAERSALPVQNGETHTIFEGCYTTVAAIKRANRDCEGALLAAESLCAMAALDRREPLRDAWLPVLFNQFHDIFCGCSIPAAYADAYRRSEQSLRVARRVSREAVGALIPQPASLRADRLVLVNPLGFERTEPVRAKLPRGTACLEDEAGRIVPVQKDGGLFCFVAEGVPAFGAKAYRIRKEWPRSCQKTTVSITEDRIGVLFEATTSNMPLARFYRIETSHARIILSQGSGVIGSYFDKALDRELIEYGMPRPITHCPVMRSDLAMNVFQVLHEKKSNLMPAWLMNATRTEENLLEDAQVELLENGPVFARFRVEHRYRDSRIEETIVFYRDFARVDFDVTVDWHEKGSDATGVPHLKLGFAAEMRAPRVRTEGPFIVTERAASGQQIPTQKWVDLSGDDFGFALYNDATYGCDAMGGRLRMSLLRSSYAPARDSDGGTFRFRFGLDPHRTGLGTAELVRRGSAFNRPMESVVAKPSGNPSLSVLRLEGDDNVVCTSLRRAERSDGLVVRFFECEGRKAAIRFAVPESVASAREINFHEEPLAPGRKPRSGWLATTMRPYEVKTFLLIPRSS